MSAGPVAYSLLAYIVGLTLYVSDFPERLAPGGLFDTVSDSDRDLKAAS